MIALLGMSKFVVDGFGPTRRTQVNTTMERRKFLIGAGSLAAGGAAALGSGAFTSVEADRDVTVEVTGDASALLGITPADTPNGDAYADDSGGTVSIDLTTTDGVAGAPEGVNERAFTLVDNILTLTNQGSQDVLIGAQIFDSDGNVVGDQASVGIGGPILRLDEGGPGFATGPGPNYDEVDGGALSPGDSVDMGLFFNLSKQDNFDNVIDDVETIQFVAEADN